MKIEQYVSIPTELVKLFNGREIWAATDNLQSFIASFRMDKNGNVIHKTAKIHHTAIVQNSYIGPKTVVYEFVTIRESFVWENIQIGHSSEVVRSIILRNSSIPRFNYVGASIVGNNVRLGGMCAFASRRFDDHKVFIVNKGERLETGKNKFGSVIGDNTIIGFAAHGNPGTVIGKNCIIMPHVELKGVVPHNSVVSVQQSIIFSKKRDVESLGLQNLKR